MQKIQGHEGKNSLLVDRCQLFVKFHYRKKNHKRGVQRN